MSDDVLMFSTKEQECDAARLKKQKAKIALLRTTFPKAFLYPAHSDEQEALMTAALLRLEKDGEVSLVVHKGGFPIAIRRKKK